ncbi:MAG: CehA/McbA family metallohydrolase [Actinomycetes bacterium]
MCDDHGDDVWLPGHGSGHPTRRSFLSRLGVIGAGAAVLTQPFGRALAATRDGPVAAQSNEAWFGRTPTSMAMHVHSSFSEGSASMRAQISEAAATGVQAMWFTEHDWRMSAHDYRNAYHFDSFNESENGLPWAWKFAQSGALSDYVAEIVTSPVSPADPSSTPGALHLRARSSSGIGSYSAIARDGNAHKNLRAVVAGQTWRLEVFPTQISSGGWLELLLQLSYLPATGGRPAGIYQISYRFGTKRRTVTTQGLLGIVTVPVQANRWNSVVLDLEADIAALWPDIEARDHSTSALSLGATSVKGAAAEGYVDYLRFARSLVADQPLGLQDDLIAAYKSQYPGVLIQRGQEISFIDPHINAFGGNQHLFQYSDASLPTTQELCDLVHSWGGVASINHPFGTSLTLGDGVPIPITDLLQTKAWGAEILEVGYRLRGKTLEDHLGLWDTLSSSGIWVTGNGVSDDHGGVVGSWATMTNRFLTYAYTASVTTSEMLSALRSGRVFCSEIGSYAGQLAINAGSAQMGSISVLTRTSRKVAILATALSSKHVVEVVQGPIDYSGSTANRSKVVQTVPASAFDATGNAYVNVDTTSDTFVRINLVDTTTSTRVAFTNPLYLLRSAPPGGIPPARQA